VHVLQRTSALSCLRQSAHGGARGADGAGVDAPLPVSLPRRRTSFFSARFASSLFTNEITPYLR
jgi:hypothetical protein